MQSRSSSAPRHCEASLAMTRQMWLSVSLAELRLVQLLIRAARVLLKDPALLIFDEATSALDSISEAAIQAAINPLIEERTSILIAHRLSTILAADEILVVRDGRIVERGKHSDLVHAGGTYQELYETQFSKADA